MVKVNTSMWHDRKMNVGWVSRLLRNPPSAIKTIHGAKIIAAIASYMLFANIAHADPMLTNYKHLGVGSCAAGTCHGKLAPQSGTNGTANSNVAQNEYRKWQTDDLHSQAYTVLENAKSKSIAAKLGIGNPTSAAMCLDCHADNVPAAQRGPKFQIRDGVSCEACHGGAEKWIESHTAKTATHQANIGQGMYATESPRPRAELCTSCHLGTRNKFATHMIMGAGHPRLVFELETFVANQPAHYTVDADYVVRKGKISGMRLWLTGQLTVARQYASLLQSPLYHTDRILPELSFYDCHSCHHPMTNVRWSQQRVGGDMKPGMLRLQTQSLLMLQTVSEVLDPGSTAELSAARMQLVHAGQIDRASVDAAVNKIQDWLKAHDSWADRQFTDQETSKVRRAVVALAAEDKAFDYMSAEQVVFSVQTLTYALGDLSLRKAPLDQLFNAVKDQTNFDPAKFAATARSVQEKF